MKQLTATKRCDYGLTHKEYTRERSSPVDVKLSAGGDFKVEFKAFKNIGLNCETEAVN